MAGAIEMACRPDTILTSETMKKCASHSAGKRVACGASVLIVTAASRDFFFWARKPSSSFCTSCRRPHIASQNAWSSADVPAASTGGTLVAAIDYVFARGARDVTAVCLLAAPEGIQVLENAVGDRVDVQLVVAAVDERLNEKAYIVPGLGDAGDRLYGVV